MLHQSKDLALTELEKICQDFFKSGLLWPCFSSTESQIRKFFIHVSIWQRWEEYNFSLLAWDPRSFSVLFDLQSLSLLKIKKHCSLLIFFFIIDAISENIKHKDQISAYSVFWMILLTNLFILLWVWQSRSENKHS